MQALESLLCTPMQPLTQGATWELWPRDLCYLARFSDPAFQETFQVFLMTLHLGWVGSQEAGYPSREARCSLVSKDDRGLRPWWKSDDKGDHGSYPLGVPRYGGAMLLENWTQL